MARSMIKWVAAGALISIGVVGFLTGLVLLPFGIILAGSAAGGHERSWPGFVIGLGIGPVALLADDMGDSVPASGVAPAFRSEEHTSELQSLLRKSYAVFCLKK